VTTWRELLPYMTVEELSDLLGSEGMAILREAPDAILHGRDSKR